MRISGRQEKRIGFEESASSRAAKQSCSVVVDRFHPPTTLAKPPSHAPVSYGSENNGRLRRRLRDTVASLHACESLAGARPRRSRATGTGASFPAFPIFCRIDKAHDKARATVYCLLFTIYYSLLTHLLPHPSTPTSTHRTGRNVCPMARASRRRRPPAAAARAGRARQPPDRRRAPCGSLRRRRLSPRSPPPAARTPSPTRRRWPR